MITTCLILVVVAAVTLAAIICWGMNSLVSDYLKARSDLQALQNKMRDDIIKELMGDK